MIGSHPITAPTPPRGFGGSARAIGRKVWYGPDAMLTPMQLLLEDKREEVEYDVEIDSRVRPGSTYPNCQV